MLEEFLHFDDKAARDVVEGRLGAEGDGNGAGGGVGAGVVLGAAANDDHFEGQGRGGGEVRWSYRCHL